jgi:hypothetical protein
MARSERKRTPDHVENPKYAVAALLHMLGSIRTTGAYCLAAAAIAMPPAFADAPATGAVQVTYLHPEAFTDVGDDGSITTARRRDALLAQLARHIEHRAAAYTPAGGKLDITVTDVDMAGEFERWRRNAGHARIVRDVYPPRIRLAFRLADAAGKTVSEGRRELTDLAFMIHMEYPDDPLRHEKRLLDDWLAREFPVSPGTE